MSLALSTFNEKSKEGYYLVFNRDEIFKNLIASEGHFRNFTNLKEDEKGFLNCIVKHLADAEGHCDEAISHALIAEDSETSRRFLELRDEIRSFRKWIQSSPITRDEGIREIRKLRRRFEAFNPDYDVSKCETCGDTSGVMEDITKIIKDLKENQNKVAAHGSEVDDFLVMEREMAEKVIIKLSEKYGVKPPKIIISDKCHEPMIGLYTADQIMVCKTGVNLHVLAHEFWHHVQKENGLHLDEGEAEKFSLDLFKTPYQKGLYSMHNNLNNERKMVKSIKDVGTIYGLQQLGYATDYALRYADTLRPTGFLGQPISFWGDILGTVGGIAGALKLKAPYDLAAAIIGGYLSTDLWNHLARLVPMGLVTPPLVYTPAGTVVTPGMIYTPAPVTTTTIRPTPFVTKGRYVVTG
uniref:Uncharacterized protein n=1 Tax=viral metagenome TaxID=1070528 RepID=A0A6M3MFD0_9ZZZZ